MEMGMVSFTIYLWGQLLLPVPGNLYSTGLEDKKLSRNLLELQH